MMKKTEGFSLIELLVVVAIIGVLAAVGITGYQAYISNTRADVTKTNAQSVERWLGSTQIARSGGLTIDPARCDTVSGSLEDCFTNMGATSDDPFYNFKNAFQSAAAAPLLIYRDNTSSLVTEGAGCFFGGDNSTTHTSWVKAATGTDIADNLSTRGAVLIQNTSSTADNLTLTTNTVTIGWCDETGLFKQVAAGLKF